MCSELSSSATLHLQDNCLNVLNKNQRDQDSDGVVDVCDNCIYAPNNGQENNDGDATGDECDEDDDNDGIGNLIIYINIE